MADIRKEEMNRELESRKVDEEKIEGVSGGGKALDEILINPKEYVDKIKKQEQEKYEKEHNTIIVDNHVVY